MADNTIILQGKFTSDGTAKLLDLRSDVDWMEVLNATQWATTQATGRGVKFEWQRGMAAGAAFEYTKADSSSNALQGEWVSSGGFSLLDPLAGPEAEVTGTTITKAATAVATAAGHGYSNGDVVLIYDGDAMTQIDGCYFTIDGVTTNTFDLTYFDSNTSNFTANTSFKVRRIPNPHLFLPQLSRISSVTTGTTTDVQLLVDGLGIAVGDVLRFSVGADWGMTELDGLTGEVLSIDTATNTYTVDIDSSSFTAFAWPATTAFPTTFAQAVPFGTNSTTPNGLYNNEKLQMKLGAGIDGPAGSSSDVIYWRAGKSFSVSNS
jgi:hypothetical protein